MLAAERPDFVDVVTTVESHRALVERALAHGAAVVCQKPFAETFADAAAMVAAADRAGRPLLVHENFRWQRPFLALKARLDAGAVGAPQFARIAFRHRWDVYATQPYLATVERFAIMDVGLHLFDLARFLLGDVADVHCRTQRRNPRVRGEDAFLASLRHASGAVTAVECSFFSTLAPEPFPQTLATVEGADGTLELAPGYRLRLHRDGRAEETAEEPPVPAWGARPWHVVQDSVAAFQRHVVDVLAGRAAPQPSGAHNLDTLALALAAYRSVGTGAAVDVARFVAEGARP
jgi:predicted dehydrogenase